MACAPEQYHGHEMDWWNDGENGTDGERVGRCKHCRTMKRRGFLKLLGRAAMTAFTVTKFGLETLVPEPLQRAVGTFELHWYQDGISRHTLRGFSSNPGHKKGAMMLATQHRRSGKSVAGLLQMMESLGASAESKDEALKVFSEWQMDELS